MFWFLNAESQQIHIKKTLNTDMPKRKLSALETKNLKDDAINTYACV